MKKLVVCILSCMMIFLLVGCDKKVTLNTEENDLIAEYIAGVMLKYSFNDKWNYEKAVSRVDSYKQKNPASLIGGGATSATEPTKSSTSNTPISNAATAVTPTKDIIETLSSALEIEGVDIQYKTYSVGDRYPTEEYAISVPAGEGYKVLALEFELTNNSGSAINLDTYNKGVVFRLGLKERAFTQYASMLKNDLVFLKDISVNAGSTYTAVVLFQIPDSLANDVAGGTLSVYQNNSLLGTMLTL